MKICVTQADIDNGFPGSPDTCPVALAISKVLNEEPYVEVYGDEVEIDYNTIELPEKVHKFVKAFDRNEDVIPFEFDLNYKP